MVLKLALSLDTNFTSDTPVVLTAAR